MLLRDMRRFAHGFYEPSNYHDYTQRVGGRGLLCCNATYGRGPKIQTASPEQQWYENRGDSRAAIAPTTGLGEHCVSGLCTVGPDRGVGVFLSSTSSFSVKQASFQTTVGSYGPTRCLDPCKNK
jgi:hypothetical protein